MAARRPYDPIPFEEPTHTRPPRASTAGGVMRTPLASRVTGATRPSESATTA